MNICNKYNLFSSFKLCITDIVRVLSFLTKESIHITLVSSTLTKELFLIDKSGE